MGILTLYLEERKRQKDFEEQKRQFGEKQKLDKAQTEINKQNSERLLRELMETISSKKINISPTMTSPEGERTQHPFFKETGVAPDFSSAVFGDGDPYIQEDKAIFGDWYEGLQKRRQGETAHEYKMKEIEQTQKMQKRYDTTGGKGQLTEYQKHLIEQKGKIDWNGEYIKFIREALLPEEKMNPEGFIESLQIPALQAEARKALLGEEGQVTPTPTEEELHPLAGKYFAKYSSFETFLNSEDYKNGDAEEKANALRMAKIYWNK